MNCSPSQIKLNPRCNSRNILLSAPLGFLERKRNLQRLKKKITTNQPTKVNTQTGTRIGNHECELNAKRVKGEGADADWDLHSLSESRATSRIPCTEPGSSK